MNLIKPLTISLIGLSIFSTNVSAGTPSGAFTEISMFNSGHYQNPQKCVDNYAKLNDGTVLTYVKVYDDGTRFPRNLGTGQFDKYSIYKPKNTVSATVSSETLQANHTYTYTYTSSNYKTVEEYKSSVMPSPSETHITANIGPDDEEMSYLYLGIPSIETKQAMVLSNVTVAYYVSNTNCDAVRGGTVSLETPTPTVEDPVVEDEPLVEDTPLVEEEKTPHEYSPETGVLMDENYNFHINNINIDTPNSVVSMGADFELVKNEDGTLFRRDGDDKSIMYFKLSNSYFAANDQDSDGYTVEDGDCNDNDATIHPNTNPLLEKTTGNCIIGLETP